MDDLVEKILRGETQAAARLIRNIDDRHPGAIGCLKKLFPYAGRAVTLGVTGSPGVGKSCLTGLLIQLLRRRGRTVGVLAVDPSSPVSGGAVLGDRVRFQRHSEDAGVFIRSLASRGEFGGLTRATRGAITVMDAMGLDVIIIETVGVGQAEINIAHSADTTVIVLAPGMGDTIQAVKAGIMEVGDVFAVNKADCSGADQTAEEIEGILRHGHTTFIGERDWLPPVLKTVSIDKGAGIEALWEQIEAHRRYVAESNSAYCRRMLRFKLKRELLEMVRQAVVDSVMETLDVTGELDGYVERCLARETDPYTVCEKILSSFRSTGM